MKKSVLNDQIGELSKRCARKIHSILKNNQDSTENTRNISIEIMRRMMILSDNNHLKLKSLFVTLVKTISGVSKSVSC